jgi:hypothetical protein
VKILGALLLLVAPNQQADPVAAARKELGSGFTCELVENGVIAATDAGPSRFDTLKACLKKAVVQLRAHAFDPAPANTILVCSFKDTEGFKEYVGKRYPERFELPVFYDAVQRRLVVHAEIAEEFAPASVLTFLLGEHLGTPIPPPWAAAAIIALNEKPGEAEAIYDPHAALLQGALRRGAVPALSALLQMDLSDFRAPGRSGLHATLSRKLALFLKSNGQLSNFFAEFKASAKRDATGLVALEKALGKTIDAIDRDFVAYLTALPWVREDRFREHAKKGFSGPILFKADNDLFLAIATDVDEATVTRALAEVRTLHGPLLKHLNLQPTGLPVTVRLFRDEISFQNFAKMDSPDRGWFAGYYVPTTRSIAVNLSGDPTGLTHEFCHSLFEDDLGVLPPWAGEGLASLYQDFHLEKDAPVADRKQTVKTVQAALDQGRLPPLVEFVQMKAQGFWGDRERMKVHYDLARAVFLYLQERNALQKWIAFVKAARAAQRLAPPIATCRNALEKALGMKLDAIDDDFRRWVAAPAKER